MLNMLTDIDRALAAIEDAKKTAPPVEGYQARLIMAEHNLRRVLDDERRRLERLRTLAGADPGRCERGVYVNA